MSRWSKGFFALIAASLAFGAVHLEIASGSDLKMPMRGDADLFGSRGVGATRQLVAEDVNRAVKSDRLAAAVAGTSGPTIVFKVAGLKNTSIATFRPLPQISSQGSPAPKSILSTTACEPPVSALAEAARVIERGRCIT
jgi:hypothetical protein